MHTSTCLLRSYFLALAWLAASLGVVLALLARPAGAESIVTAERSQAMSGPNVITATPTPGCDLAWRRFPSPNVGTGSSYLTGVSAISGDDAWAVGRTTSPEGTLTMHWDGTHWSVVPSPNPGPNISVSGVTAISHDDVWAVGNYDNGRQLLTMHWNGEQWSVVPNPNPGGNYFNSLSAVDATASNDVWAVGFYRHNSPQGLVMRWTGSQWSVVPSPMDPAINFLVGVDAVAPDDVWVVGYYGPGGTIPYQAFAMHWDGSGWTVTPTPNLGVGSYFQGVAALSPNDVWAVGYTYNGGAPQALSEHWDGSAWSVVPVPAGLSGLDSVDASAPDDVWALDTEGAIIHWDGTAWALVPIPGISQFLTDIDVRAADDIWVVGYIGPTSGPYGTQTWRYSSQCLPGTSTPSPTPLTQTLTPGATATQIATNTATANPSMTLTSTPTYTALSTATVLATPTQCDLTFTDVPSDSTFYTFIRCLACRGIVSGYDDGTFRPFNDITRGQIAKMVSNAAGFDEDPGPQLYEDVPEGSPFYEWINRLSNREHIGGYPCGLLPEEPCIEPDNLPYFRPANSATRGQLAKIVSNAAALDTTPTGVFYTDVQEDHPFYVWIMRLTDEGVMSGYECGGEGEPCDEENRPYFRPFNNVTRGQASKIVANTFYPNCTTLSGR